MTDIINTRSAVLVSHNDFIDATLVEESIASSLDSQKDDVMRNDNDIPTGSMNVTAAKIDGGSNSDANQSKDSQEIDASAFKSQFDEILNASRLLENAKLTNFNNRYNGLIGQATLTNHLPLRRTNGDQTGPFHTHQRSSSHPHPSSFTGRQHILQHKRSASSISGLSFNGSYTNSNPGPYYSGRNNLNSLPNTPLGANLYEQDEYLPLRLHHQLGELNPDKAAFGEIDDDGLRLKTLRDLNNNNRYDLELDWDSSPTLSSNPGGQFTTPITPPSNYSTRSSTPYFAQSHMLLDDDELLEKQLILEEEQKLLSFQKQKLDNAINQLRYHNNDPNLIESKFKYLPSPPRPRPTTPSSRKQPSRNLLIPSSSQQSSTPPRFQHNHQEPIGTPLRKMSNSGFGTNPSTPTTPASVSDQQSSFSLFSKSPALSLNHVFLPKVNEYDGKAFDGLHGGFPLTPAGTPPKNDEGEGYFFGSHYLNPRNNYHATNSGRSQQRRESDNYHRSSAPLTPSYYPICSQFTAPQFPSQHTPNSVTGYSSRASLYSSPVDERDEDILMWNNDAFEKLPIKCTSSARNNVFPTNDESGWERYLKIENKLHQKLHDVPSSVMTSSNVNGLTSKFMETAAFGNHRHGFELEVV